VAPTVVPLDVVPGRIGSAWLKSSFEGPAAMASAAGQAATAASTNSKRSAGRVIPSGLRHEITKLR
jgi:hypothetical protein